MRLPKDGQEYVRIQFENYPAVGATAEASFDRVTWYSISVDPNGLALFLVRGPLCSLTTGVLVSAGTEVWTRVTGSPEQVIRHAGEITLE